MKRWLVVVLWVTVSSCGPDVPPSTLRGTSEHFRLFVDDSLVPPAGFSFDDALVALETNWSDTRTILAMPDGQIDYYWLTEDHVVPPVPRRQVAASSLTQSTRTPLCISTS